MEKIHDKLGMMVLVEEEGECYLALSLVHQLWPSLPDEFDDYIQAPKPNGYRAIHTRVEPEKGRYLEVQIKTRSMHENNEYGSAAHSFYKDSNLSRAPLLASNHWLSRLIKIRQEREGDDSAEGDFLTEMLSNEVFVFTPKGDLLVLQKDATALDFAYRIHSEVGDRCVGVKINGKAAHLTTLLRTGDRVEVLLAKTAKSPSPDWLRFVREREVKKKIRRKLREIH